MAATLLMARREAPAVVVGRRHVRRPIASESDGPIFFSMNIFKKDQKLRLRAVQLISHDGWVLLRRGCLEFKLSGEGVAPILEALVRLWEVSDFTVEEVREAFPESQHHIIMAILESLAKRDILVPAAEIGPNRDAESSEDIFYWNLGENRTAILERLNKNAILIIGVNRISAAMVTELRESGIKNCVLADDPLLRNEMWCEDQERVKIQCHRQNVVCIDAASIAWSDQGKFGCVVATSDFGLFEIPVAVCERIIWLM